ncbi:hypothetical protein LOTGIDRAFT_174270 [Lottia gigantea]|uniref:Centrosomal protein POC5 n=1 Tax=Lottia gigantea TaxID=225164 RepID=V4AXX6_LOTGI|nr:hypothetical protein LOTGIDRAFT_174270 [Lottia gigantea]ESO98461.1 hypothetical protein LOTGIDRAFT_174270 [Lottia gigantea]
MSSDICSTASIPDIPPDSPGSSVSSRLQEEYEELLKYAVVAPKFDSSSSGTKTVTSLPPVSVTRETTSNPTPTAYSKVLDENLTPRSVNPQPTSLPDFCHSPIPNYNCNSGSDTLEKPDDMLQNSRNKQFTWQKASQGSFEPLNMECEQAGDDIIYTATVDTDVTVIENILDQSCLDLKRNVLAEFGQVKIKIVENARQELHREQERNVIEKNKLINEIDSLKELLHTYEQSMERKDQVISNLTHAMQKQKDRKDMMKQFSEWKIRHNDVKRETFCSNLAKRHYEKNLAQKVWAAWHSVLENNWRSKIERACQAKAQEVCMQLTNDYEMKIGSLNEELERRRYEIDILHSERDKYEEAMKKAFMRGVCALNLEAMNMFHGSDEEQSGGASGKSNDGYSDNLDGNFPQKEYGTSKTIPRDSTESLPSRIVTSQGSRPHSVSHPKSVVYLGYCESLPSRIVTSQGSRSPSFSHPKSVVYLGCCESLPSRIVTSQESRPHIVPHPKSVISKQSAGVTSISSKKSNSAKFSSKTTSSANQKSRPSTASMGSTTVAPPMASVVVERHPPVNKQTIGQATASKFPKGSDGAKPFKRLAGQTGTITITPHVQSVKVVD